MNAWWDSYSPGFFQEAILIQFDLGGHSSWAAEQPVTLDVAKARAEFANKLKEQLAYEQFHPLYWLGDGGVFARPYKSPDDPDAAVNAADVAFDCFSRFRDSVEGGSKLSFRATATLISIILFPDPGH